MKLYASLGSVTGSAFDDPEIVVSASSGSSENKPRESRRSLPFAAEKSFANRIVKAVPVLSAVTY
jgi:hypothetical protein